MRIQVLVQRSRISGYSVFVDGFRVVWIAAEEPTCRGIVVSGAQIVEAEIGIVLFAAIALSFYPSFVPTGPQEAKQTVAQNREGPG